MIGKKAKRIIGIVATAAATTGAAGVITFASSGGASADPVVPTNTSTPTNRPTSTGGSSTSGYGSGVGFKVVVVQKHGVIHA
jgi:hypothetical protein